MELPLLSAIRQTVSQPRINDVDAEVRRQWQQSSLPQRIRPGDRVAVAVGSRGIANLAARLAVNQIVGVVGRKGHARSKRS